MPHQRYQDSASAPRVGIYRNVFRTTTVEETTGALLWGQAVAMCLHPLIAAFEVALRNRIHVSLSQQAAEIAAAQNPTLPYMPWYDVNAKLLNLQGETAAKVARAVSDLTGPSGAAPPAERVISALSFGVWTNVLDAQLPNASCEARTFLEVFPHYPRKPRKYWNFIGNRKDVVDRLKDVRAWRNRLAHCKPVWSEGWYRSSPNKHWSEVLQRVAGRRQQMEETLGWICPQTLSIYQLSYPGRLLGGLMTEAAVFHYLQDHLAATPGPQFPTADPIALAQFKARL